MENLPSLRDALIVCTTHGAVIVFYGGPSGRPVGFIFTSDILFSCFASQHTPSDALPPPPHPFIRIPKTRYRLFWAEPTPSGRVPSFRKKKTVHNQILTTFKGVFFECFLQKSNYNYVVSFSHVRSLRTLRDRRFAHQDQVHVHAMSRITHTHTSGMDGSGFFTRCY